MRIDSFMPRRFSDEQQRDQRELGAQLVRKPIDAGSRLNSASTPLATEMAIVST